MLSYSEGKTDDRRDSPAALPAVARLPAPHGAGRSVHRARPRAVRAPQLPEPHPDPPQRRGALAHACRWCSARRRSASSTSWSTTRTARPGERSTSPTLRHAYREARISRPTRAALRGILEARWERLVDLTAAMLEFLRDAFDIRTPLVRSSELGVEGAKSS